MEPEHTQSHPTPVAFQSPVRRQGCEHRHGKSMENPTQRDTQSPSSACAAHPAMAVGTEPRPPGHYLCVPQDESQVAEGQQAGFLLEFRDSELEAPLGLVGDGGGDGQGGGGSGGRSVPDVQHPAAHGPRAPVEHKIIHQVALTVQGLGSHTRGTPAKVKARRSRRKMRSLF